MARRKTPEERLAELRAAQDKLAARISDEKTKLRKQQRKDDARRKIIYGSVVLAHAEIDPEFDAQLQHLINRHTTRDADREFLGLPPRGRDASNQNEEPASGDTGSPSFVERAADTQAR